jgi:hypothetical protein
LTFHAIAGNGTGEAQLREQVGGMAHE